MAKRTFTALFFSGEEPTYFEVVYVDARSMDEAYAVAGLVDTDDTFVDAFEGRLEAQKALDLHIDGMLY